MRKAYKYRAYPNRAQSEALTQMLETHRHLYNRALQERKETYEAEKRSVTYGQQSARLKVERETNAYLALTNFSSCQATLRRLEKAFQAFFRRTSTPTATGFPSTRGDAARRKAGEKAGYPRFRGKNRFDTVEFPAYGDGCKLKDGRIYFQHVGLVKLKLHRPLAGKIKTVSFKREADGWYVVFSCELNETPIEPSANPAIGIDLGLKAFFVTSDGTAVAPPKFFRKSEHALRRAQRRLCRRVKGSRGRATARQQVAKLHQHIANQRRDFHHKVARTLVDTYGLVAHEDLNVKGIARTRLAKSTHDAGWAGFLAILHSKAEEAGVTVIAVPPKNTTQLCSACGALPDIPKTLSDRVHICPHCGFTADRDENAARNILHLAVNRLGLSRWALTPALADVAQEATGL